MILYFTGTGNSRYAAEYIGAALCEETVSINELMKRGEYPAFHSEKPYLVVAPVYAWRLPHVAEDFLRKCTFSGCREMGFLLTCGSSIGNAGDYAEKLCGELGLAYRGMADVIMPENFITMFRAPSEKDEARIMEMARRRLKSIAEQMTAGKELTQKGPKIKLASALVNPAFYKLFVTAKHFRVKDGCNGCGRCVKLCPLNNISLEGEKPVWGENCTQCMACICGCPKERIEYGRRTAGKRRYWCRPFHQE